MFYWQGEFWGEVPATDVFIDSSECERNWLPQIYIFFFVTQQFEISEGSSGSHSSLHFLNWQLEKLYSTWRDKRQGASEEGVTTERKEW